MTEQEGHERLRLLREAHQGRRRLRGISEEDYIEAIYEIEKAYGYARLTDISNTLGVKPSTVLSMVRRLEEKGLAEHMRYRGVRLTEKGRELARRIAESHEFIRRFLISLGVDEERANVEAELIEHLLSADTVSRLRRFYEECRNKHR